MDIFTIPRAQTLRFVNQNEIDDVQSYDNRLVFELSYPRMEPYEYSQLIEKTDDLWLQFRTNYNDFQVIISDCDENETDLTSLANLIYTDSSDRNYYYLPIDASVLEGYYQILIIGETPLRADVSFLSEVFYIQETFEDSRKVEWRGNSFSYDDQMHWDGFDNRAFVRSVCLDKKMTPLQSKTTYQNSDYTPINLIAKPNRSVTLEIDSAPFWIVEKINIGLCHDEFYLNEIQYNSEETIEIEEQEDLLKIGGSVELTEIDYENGEDKAISGEINQSFIAFNDSGDRMLFNDLGDYTKANF